MSFLDELHKDWKRFAAPAGQAVKNIKNAAIDAVEDYKEAQSTKIHVEKPHAEKQNTKMDRDPTKEPVQISEAETPVFSTNNDGTTDPPKKVGCLCSLPVCILCVLWFFPVGLILLFVRLYKKGRIRKRTRNIAIGINAALIVLIAVLALIPSDSDRDASASPQISAAVEAQKENTAEKDSEAASGQDMPETKEEVAPILPDVENVPDEEKDWTEDDLQDVLNRICLYLSGAATGEEVGITEEDILATAQAGNDACDYYYQSMRETIDAFLEIEPVNQGALWDAYAGLLAVRVDEYLFKTYGYGYFTGNYDPERFDDVVKECAVITEEMRRYFNEEDVKDLYVEQCLTSSDYEFDESRFNYDPLLIGSPAAPDMEAMWGLYFAIMALST